MIDRAHDTYTIPLRNVYRNPSEGRNVTFFQSDTQDPYRHWQRGQDPVGPLLELEPVIFGMVGECTTTDPLTPLVCNSLSSILLFSILSRTK